jgi:hypothetical protein
MSNGMNKRLIAPCGMNCGICMAYLREKNQCPGCRRSDIGKAISVTKCRIKTCEVLKNKRARFCFQCENLPCDRLKHLDRRYRTKYDMSMLDNLIQIKQGGIEAFLLAQRSKYRCPRCGGTVCVHNKRCYRCDPPTSRIQPTARRQDVR